MMHPKSSQGYPCAKLARKHTARYQCKSDLVAYIIRRMLAWIPSLNACGSRHGGACIEARERLQYLQKPRFDSDNMSK